MSIITTTTTKSTIGNSLWQQESEARQDMGSKDDQTWMIAASWLASDNQFRKNGRRANNGDDPHRKASLTEIWPPPSKTITFYGQGRHDKWYKTLPPAEMLPSNEMLGGYIFVCNNETMQEDLRRQLFGLPQKYKDSVRAITPGLPLFLYNYTAHQMHGVYQALSFGGSNIDPTAWEDKKCRGESRFPAQVRIRIKKKYKPLEEDAFRPILYHYDGPKFRLQLSVPEALALLDLFTEDDM
ncbi:hypothetical protein HHK36_007715 [Tetracentron sinense]|uniref:DCD domain-containing protein n=1 Tax=Tetracentron sinense TaxID=13715 RepID=A0A834ZD55_TETSI|nr:hypothetical protein HHK36_007715 [Tetracentron sinense]